MTGGGVRYDQGVARYDRGVACNERLGKVGTGERAVAIIHVYG